MSPSVFNFFRNQTNENVMHAVVISEWDLIRIVVNREVNQIYTLYSMTNGLSSACLSSMLVEVLLFSVVSVHGLKLMGGAIAPDVSRSSYAARLVVAFGSLNCGRDGVKKCCLNRERKS